MIIPANIAIGLLLICYLISVVSVAYHIQSIDVPFPSKPISTIAVVVGYMLILKWVLWHSNNPIAANVLIILAVGLAIILLPISIMQYLTHPSRISTQLIRVNKFEVLSIITIFSIASLWFSGKADLHNSVTLLVILFLVILAVNKTRHIQ